MRILAEMTLIPLKFTTMATAAIISACATDPSPPEYLRVDMPDDAAASVLGEYLRFLPPDWERGTITISPCKDSERAEYCDFYVEHRTRKCEFGAYMIYSAGDSTNMPHYKTIPDQRAQSCLK